MIQLRTLGTLDLRDTDGQVIQSVLAQPKRTALLVYLALAHPGGMHQRDTLLNLFWGERDQERARKALRQALYYLRTSLGDDIIETIGDAEVGVSRAGLLCDAVDFETSCDDGRSEDALALYRGELLPGFHLDDAPEFDNWLSTARIRLRERMVGAAMLRAEQLAGSGDHVAAAEWTRRAAGLEPLDERLAQLLIRHLDRAGDRAGALRTFDAFAERLRGELDVDPSPQTVALANALRASRSASPSTPPPDADTARPSAPSSPPQRSAQRPRRTVPLLMTLIALAAGSISLSLIHANGAPEADERLVMIAPFRVSGMDSVLSEQMVDLLAMRVAAQSLRAVDPTTVLSSWRARFGSTAVVAHDDARALAETLGAAWLAIGTLTRVDSAITVSVTMSNVRGNLRTPLAETASRDSLHVVLDRIAARLYSQHAGEPVERLSRPSPSLPAQLAYLNGRSALRGGRYAEAASQFDIALSLDTAFALAALGRYETAMWIEAADPQLLTMALAGRDRLGPVDAALVDALTVDRAATEPVPTRTYVEALDNVVRLAPERAWPHFAVGDLLFHFGPWIDPAGADDRAWNALAGSVERDSTHTAPLVHLFDLAVKRSDVAAANRLANAFLRRHPDHDFAFSVRWRNAIVQRDSSALVRARRDVRNAAGPSLLHMTRASLELPVALEDGELAQRELLRRAASTRERNLALWASEYSARNRGRIDLADSLAELRGGPSPMDVIRNALYWDGDSAAAATATKQLTREYSAIDSSAPLGRQHSALCLAEQWRLWSGDTSHVAHTLQLLDEVVQLSRARRPVTVITCRTLLLALVERTRNPTGPTPMLDSLDAEITAKEADPELGYGLALSRLHTERGRHRDALRAAQLRAFGLGKHLLSSYLLQEARSAQEAGELETARRVYRHYLAIRSEADATLARHLEEVADELVRLDARIR